MKTIIIFVLLMQLTYASKLNLAQVLDAADANNALSHAIEQEGLYLEAKNKADTASRPIEVFGMGTKAYPKGGLIEGDEYTAGLSKKIYLGDTQAQEQTITRLNNSASLLEGEREGVQFINTLKNLYHQHCLDARAYENFGQTYRDFATLYAKKEKAYHYGEISKTELMQLQIEKNKLSAKLNAMQQMQGYSKQKLLMLSRLTKASESTLSCTDMYPITDTITIHEEGFKLTKEAYQKRLQSTKTALKRHAKAIDSATLSAQYQNEIDIERYSIGVSVPLAFTSKKSEQERAAALYKNTAISYRHEQDMLEKKSMFTQLQSTLKIQAMGITSLKQNIAEYQKTLLPLMKKSYALKESSVVEYLLNMQAYNQLKQELFDTQKEYYNTLFALYTLSETKDNK